MESHANSGDPDAPFNHTLLASLYPEKIAATRLRLGLVAKSLKDLAIPSKQWTFFTDEEVDIWLSGGIARRVALNQLAHKKRDFCSISSNSQLVIIQREISPFNTNSYEKKLLKNRIPFIWDLDDALWNANQGLAAFIRGSSSKYEWMARNAQEIWSGNETLMTWCKKMGGQNVHLLPTLAQRHHEIVSAQTEPDLLVWIGTPATAPFLQSLIDALGDSLRGWRVLVVGGTIHAPPGISVECRPWTLDAEKDAVRRGYVGLYPIDENHPMASGKSGLKCLTYLSHGIPVIATNTQSNRAILSTGSGGLLVSNISEWIGALNYLRSSEVRESLSRDGLIQVRSNYSDKQWVRWMTERIKVNLSS